MSLSELNDQIDKLTENVPSLAEKLTFQPSPIEVPDIEQDIPDDREVMKGIFQYGESGVKDNPEMSEEDAHFLAYGHNDINSKEVVKEKAIPEDHPKMRWIKETKKEVKIALKQLKNKGAELVSASTLLSIQVGSSVATIGSSAIVFPIGSGLPTAFNALMSIFASLEAFVTKLNDILPILDKLKPVGVLLLMSSRNPDTVVAPIVASLATLNGLLSTLETSAGSVNSLKDKVPVPSGGVDLSGNQTTPEPIKVEIEEKYIGSDKYKLKCTASEGTWDYKSYRWESSDPNEILQSSNTDNITVRPLINDGTEYRCIVTDSMGNKGTKKIKLKP